MPSALVWGVPLNAAAATGGGGWIQNHSAAVPADVAPGCLTVRKACSWQAGQSKQVARRMAACLLLALLDGGQTAFEAAAALGDCEGGYCSMCTEVWRRHQRCMHQNQSRRGIAWCHTP